MPSLSCPTPHYLHSAFLTLLPRVISQARRRCRGVRCPHRRDDLCAEAAALAWRWYLRLAERGRDATCFPAGFAILAATAALAGRRLAGQEKARDALSEQARRRGVTVVRLAGALADVLTHNTRTPVPEQVGFRLDFPAWLRRLRRRDRRLVAGLLLGRPVVELAR